MGQNQLRRPIREKASPALILAHPVEHGIRRGHCRQGQVNTLSLSRFQQAGSEGEGGFGLATAGESSSTKICGSGAMGVVSAQVCKGVASRILGNNVRIPVNDDALAGIKPLSSTAFLAWGKAMSCQYSASE